MYDFLMLFCLPMCIPLGIAAVAAFSAKSRIVFVVPVIVAMLFTIYSSPPRVYVEYAPGTPTWYIHQTATEAASQHKGNAAFFSGIVTTVLMLIASEFWAMRRSNGPTIANHNSNQQHQPTHEK